MARSHGEGSSAPRSWPDLKNALEAVGQSCHTAAGPVNEVSMAKNTCAWGRAQAERSRRNCDVNTTAGRRGSSVLPGTGDAVRLSGVPWQAGRVRPGRPARHFQVCEDDGAVQEEAPGKQLA
jgi:hypothetical protein